jgi:pilus assembly protein CpaB
MSSNFIKILAVVFVVLALIVGLIAYKKGTELAQNNATGQQSAQPPANAVPQTEVVVAIKMLPAGQPIDPASVKVMGLEVVPKDYYLKIDDVAGRVPLMDIDAGTPLTPRLVKYNPVARQIPDGMKAVSLTLTDVIGVGGFVRPGDVVDVLIYLRNDQPNKVEEAQARILQKDALVLAFDDQVINPPAAPDKNQNGQQQQQQQPRHERTVVVAVPDAEVSRVMLGASMGEVRLALHPQAKDQAPQAQVAAATPPAAPDAAGATPATAPAAPAGAAPMPTPVSGASLTPASAAAPATSSNLAATPDRQALPDMPYASSDLAKLKPKHGAGHGAPQGIIIYRGTKASTVYP